jgi:hypothetical protein
MLASSHMVLSSLGRLALNMRAEYDLGIRPLLLDHRDKRGDYR